MTRTYSPDATTAGADWTKFGWDFPPYKSAEFLEAIGGAEQLDAFRTTPAYAAAVARGIVHDDEWVLDWCVPGARDEGPEHNEPGRPRRRVHVHIHRRA